MTILLIAFCIEDNPQLIYYEKKINFDFCCGDFSKNLKSLV